MIKTTVDGVTYKAIPDNYNGCTGCAAESDPVLCPQLQQTDGEINYCSDHEVIWIEQVQFKDDKLEAAGTRPLPSMRTVEGEVYKPVPVREGSGCQGCTANSTSTVRLCAQLDGDPDCHEANIIWRPVVTKLKDIPVERVQETTKVQPKLNEPMTLMLHNYMQLAQAVQQAGGSVTILETHTLPQLLETLAKNNITLKATYNAK